MNFSKGRTTALGSSVAHCPLMASMPLCDLKRLPERSFAVVVFDWQGGLEYQGPASSLISRLLTLGILIVTSAPEAKDRPTLSRFIQDVHPHLRHRLFRREGADIYGHDRSGEPFLLGKEDSLGAYVRKLTWQHGIDASDVLVIGQPSEDSLGDCVCAKPAASDELLEVLDGLASRIEKGELDPLPESAHRNPAWIVSEEGFNPARELEIEALLTVSNGYAGTRGTLFERGSALGPGTLVAGVFDLVPGENPVPGLVAAPDWIRLRMQLLTDGATGEEGSEEFAADLVSGELLQNVRILDMNRAMMWREFVHEDALGRRTLVRGFRLASQGDRHLFLQSIRFAPTNYSASLRIEAESDLYQTQHRSYLNPYPARVSVVHAPMFPLGSPAVVTYLYKGGLQIAFASSSRLIIENGQGRDAGEVVYPMISRIENRVAEHWEFEVEVGRAYRIDRTIAIYTSRDGQKPAARAREHVRNSLKKPLELHVRSHLSEWKRRWSVANVEIQGDIESERALRFACYNLMSAANPEDERVSIGARALTGSSYLGHVFWDTEIFMLPFYIFTAPDIARSLLMYRYHTLPGARENARKGGYEGAMYAWESADTGEETTPRSLISPTGERIRVVTGEQEHHITADIAYMVWQYSQITGDHGFLDGPGGEILVETARFWASRAKLGDDGRYHIEHAIGPDEYHEDIADNGYTNEMARWNLQCAADLVERRRLSGAIDEVPKWRGIAEKLAAATIVDGVLEQFRGYFGLENQTVKQENQPGGVDFRIFLDLERLGKTQLIKQADVVMLLHLHWGRYSEEVRRRSFEYYERRTLHGSSLSPAIYGLMAARLGKTELAFRYFKMAAEVDLRNNMGNASGGVHSAAQGGLWQAAVFGFAGMSVEGEGLSFNPRLPHQWRELQFQIVWKGQALALAITETAVELMHKGWSPIRVRVGVSESASAIEVEPGHTRRWVLAANEWQEVA